MKELKIQLSKLFEKKKKYQFSLRELNDLIKKARSLRDKENEKVKGYKKLRNEALKKVNSFSKKLSSFQKQFKVNEGSNYFNLKKEYDALNWKYQTEVFSPRVEKKLVSELDELERRMLVSKEVKEARKEFLKVYHKLKKLRQDASHYHEMVVNHASESEKNHDKLMKLYERRDLVRDKLKEFDDEISSVKKQINELYSKMKKEGKQVEVEIKNYNQEKDNNFRKKLKQKALIALKKFKKGKKVTIEELALIEEFKL